ncbi:hypothetical protein RDWZM_006388 [Blomia tropicalis]|uniref:Uncharacterized protein n=1 Tax=Blomia tropicalis TaxID=40697 RepID=A0A9Q0M704_BLOTA|nr:hypothetical protein RDWZM_006388 [Blomia tropicalis]
MAYCSLVVANYGEANYHSIPLAIHGEYHRVETIPTYSKHYSNPTYVHVPSNMAPIVVNLESISSPMKVQNRHFNAPGSHHHSHSIDYPHTVTHEVIKPIYHEIHEIVIPHRKIVQVIKPVKEEIKTIVHKHEYKHNYQNGHKREHKRKHKYVHDMINMMINTIDYTN